MLRYITRAPVCKALKELQAALAYKPFQLLSRNMSDSHTAGLIIIGDEILKAQTKDTNSHYLAKRLFSLGIKVPRISVIADSVEEIAEEVAMFSKKYTHVITTGGIGPTHDDVTYQGVAKAFSENLVLLPAIVRLMESYFPDLTSRELSQYNPLEPPTYSADSDLSQINPTLKMALVPASSRLHYLRKEDGTLASKFPVVQVGNVHILPGVPQLLERAFLCFEQSLAALPDRKFHTREIYLNASEWAAAPILTQGVKKFDGQVTFGSYPVMNHNYYSTKFTMESTNEEHVETAQRFLLSNLPPTSIVHFDKDPLLHAAQRIEEIINAADDEPLKASVANTYQVVENCLTTYEPSQVCVCFNGGKDCTALLHMVYAMMKKLHPNHKGKLQAMYIQGVDTFPEMESFIEESRQRYDLDLWTVKGPIRQGLSTILAQHPEVKAVLMGTRRTDPNAATLEPFQMTDPGWPSVMRVSPILDWSYQQVWCFLRKLSVPYCSLYDKGYTSIGNRGNTEPNPALRFVDHSGNEMYHPAYLLDDCLTERQGRL